MREKDTRFIFTGDTLAVVYDGNYYNFRFDERVKESNDSIIIGHINKSNKSKNCYALDASGIYHLRLIHTDEEEKNSENKDFIEDLKVESTQPRRCFIVFDKKDITLKINIDEVKLKMPEQEFYSKVDVKINYKIKSEDIIKMLEHIPNHLAIRLETNSIKKIIELMNFEIFIEKLQVQGTKFLHKSIEIEPRIIKSKIDEDDLKNEVKEIEAKRDRLNMDCDE